MRILFFFAFVLLAIGFLAPVSDAHAIWLPFAGKVLTVLTPGVVCIGEGPITIRPIALSPAGPYVITPVTRRYSHFTVSPGSWIVGFYSTVPVPGTCDTTSVPPVPVPAFTVIRFGSSLPSL